ncbi:DNA-protecting protein DprA [Rhodococcus rhodnii]|uniref:Smf protein n=2 Tax=Rhodococcus rhodnii TaxID=38312 RepID=R7WL02_9NOCA|nr:DNA-processing protein DprA [Rhodococcus rhodnii]EOM75991.1 Smf protein [Rhodococcus rhodnii LMG 5362]TXG90832.1 DNA-protecting protein DprA [Rhodococcus rhodnii]
MTTTHDPDRLARAYLSRVLCRPDRRVGALIGEVGAQEAARAIRDGMASTEISGRTAARAEIDTAAADLDAIAAMGGRFVIPEDDEWPQWRLLGFDRLDRVDDAAPIGLWVRGGRSLADLTERAVAVVGTRAASEYGAHVTAQLAGDLAADGWTIVSGAAFGIDAAAHRGALGVGGVTVAVLACGVDRAYPSGHARLLTSIARDGAIVSEYPPGTTPARHRFLARNRLVAGVSDGVVVVEAGWRSGAHNTAGWGRRLGRVVMAVPGPVTSAASVGCNRLIRENEAILVGSATDVAELVAPLGSVSRDDAAVVRDTDVLSGETLLVYEALPAHETCSPLELSRESGVRIENVRAVLPLLELEGFVAGEDAGWRRVR